MASQRRVIVRHYKGSQREIRRRYERDATRLLERGYYVESQEIIPGRRGCLGIMTGFLLLGLPFLFWRPKDLMVVTYRLEE